MFLILLLALGLAFHYAKGFEKLSTLLISGSLLGFLIIAITPLPYALFSILENRFPVAQKLPAKVAGIIVLGGSVDEVIYHQKGLVTLNGAGERLVAFAKLARQYPNAKLIFTGGTNSLSDVPKTEAQASEQFLKDVGVNTSKIIFEDKSRNTIENAKNVKELVQPKKGENWVLITSAFHMPRSVGVFEKQGWTIIPYPTDFRVNENSLSRLHYNVIDGLDILDVALHEYVGLAVYYLKGEMDKLFPSSNSTTKK